MRHPRKVEGYASFDDLTDEVLRNDYTRRFIEELAEDLRLQGDGDSSRGRAKLAGRLYNTVEKLYCAMSIMPPGNDSAHLHGLAQKVGKMQYDCTAEVIDGLAKRITRKSLDLLDENIDWNMGGKQERKEDLVEAADNLASAYYELMEAWKICERYMRH